MRYSTDRQAILTGFNELLTTASALFAQYQALDQSQRDSEGRPFDIREYEHVAHAALRINELLATTEYLLGSAELRLGIHEVNDSVAERIVTVTDQSVVVMNDFFWRVCALLGVLFAMLILVPSYFTPAYAQSKNGKLPDKL